MTEKGNFWGMNCLVNLKALRAPIQLATSSLSLVMYYSGRETPFYSYTQTTK